MFNKKIIFAFIVLILFISNSFLIGQQRLYFEHISVPQGLSNPLVNDITQDNEGFMWFATQGGLNRYDGYDFKLYKNNPADSTSLPDDNVMSLLFDTESRLWIGGFGFIATYNKDTDGFTNYNIERAGNSNVPRVIEIFEDSQKRIWIGAQSFGVQLFEKKNKSFRLIKKKEKQTSYSWGDVWSFTETETGEILAVDARDGIYKYDKSSGLFELLKFPKGKIVNNPFSIVTDDYGRIWIGEWKGKVKIYDQVSNKLEELKIYNKVRYSTWYGINGFLKDDKGYIWAAENTYGLFKINPVNYEYSRYTNNSVIENSLSSNTLFSLYQDKFGIIWIGSNRGINKLNPGKDPLAVFRLPNQFRKNNNADVITSLSAKNQSVNGSDKILWFGTIGNGLFRLNMTKNDIQNFTDSSKMKYKLLNNNIKALAQDNGNNLWVATIRGVNKLDLKTGKTKSYFLNDLQLNNGYRITDIEVDNTGSIWFATNHGVDILLPSSETVKRVPTLSNRKYDIGFLKKVKSIIKVKKPVASFLKVGEQQNLSKTITIEKATNVLIVNGGEGRVFLKNNFDYGWLEDNKGDMIWGADLVDSTFYLGGGVKNRLKISVLKLKPGEYKLRYISDQGHSYGNWNVEAPKDSLLWGIQVVEINDKDYKLISDQIKIELKRKNYMPLEEVLSIQFSNIFENVIWIGSLARGLFKYNYRTGKFVQYLPGNENSNKNIINRIFEDSYGLVWFATSSGLGMLNPETEKIKFYTQNDGLPTNIISSIQEDNFRNIWVSTASGLSKYVRNNTEDVGTFINYGTKDGLQGYSFTNASYKAFDGELFFGGTNGINYFYPGKVNSVPPSVVLTDFKVSGISVTSDSASTFYGKDINQLKQITLPYSRNNFSFEFASIHYASPEKNNIAYILEGYNNDWNYDTRRFASYTNLDPGDYVFKVKGSNGDGLWTRNEKIINITILTPWWRTWWAYGLYVLVFVGILYLVRKVELTRRLKDAELKEAGLRAQIAEAENERKTKELEEARELQLSMLPEELPNLPNLDIAAYMQTATEVGGDYYDFHVGMDGTLTVVVGDATGHGMKAGTMVTATKSLFNILAPNPDILATFSEITRVIKGMKFHQLSMCLMLLKIKGNELLVSSAAMPPALIYRKKNKAIEEIFMKGMPLGSMKNFPYTVKESHLEQGDTVLLLSDGLPELTNGSSEMYGYDRTKTEFHSVGEKEPEEIVSHLKNSASQWINGKDPDDDVTFVVIKVK